MRTIAKLLFFVLIAVTLVACEAEVDVAARGSVAPAAHAAAVLSTAPATPTTASAAPVVSTAGDAFALRAILLARHADDLPDRAALDAHGDAEAKLRSIASGDRMLVVRARALSLLRHYGSAEARAFLESVITDASQHAKLRAAAVRGLAGQDLSSGSTSYALVVAQLADPDPRVGLAAVAVMAAVPERARADLESILTSDGISEQVKAGARAALAE